MLRQLKRSSVALNVQSDRVFLDKIVDVLYSTCQVWQMYVMIV